MTKNELKDLKPRLEAVAPLPASREFKRDGHIQVRTNSAQGSSPPGTTTYVQLSRDILTAAGHKAFVDANVKSSAAGGFLSDPSIRPCGRLEKIDPIGLLYFRVTVDTPEEAELRKGRYHIYGPNLGVLAGLGGRDLFCRDQRLICFYFGFGTQHRLDGFQLEGPANFVSVPYHQVPGDPSLIVIDLRESFKMNPPSKVQRSESRRSQAMKANIAAQVAAKKPQVAEPKPAAPVQAEPVELTFGQLIAKLNEKFRAMKPGEVEVDVIKDSDGRQTIRARRTETFE